jgi:hypothetical protein
MAKASRSKAKPDPKAKGKAPAKPEPERKDNRYLRAARVIIENGEGVDPAELALKAELSPASANYCMEAFRGVTQALREAKLLPARKAPAKAPEVPVQAEQAA